MNILFVGNYRGYAVTPSPPLCLGFNSVYITLSLQVCDLKMGYPLVSGLKSVISPFPSRFLFKSVISPLPWVCGLTV